MATLGTAIANILDPNSTNASGRSAGNNVRNYKNEEFNKAATKYQETIDSNTGLAGNNKAYQEGLKKGGQLTQLQSNGAASQALGNAVSAGQTRGRAADMAASQAANAYTNNYANNVQNQQNVANQQLANQLNAQGTLMGAQLSNDQSEYQQAWNNQAQGNKLELGLGALVGGSDEKLKSKIKVGLGDDEDLRMAHYKRCGEKLKHMNPNKWDELKWEAK